MKEPWIQTYTGKQFSYFECGPEQICIEDIARALSNLCRFTGHCKKFYSVAQHSVLVSHRTKNPLLGLMHDADEAYTGDMCRPLKHNLEPNSKFIEAGELAWAAIKKKWPALHIVTYDEECDCKYHDMRMLVTESHDLLLNGPHPDWQINQKTHPRYDDLRIDPWSPDFAMDQFLQRFAELNATIPNPWVKYLTIGCMDDAKWWVRWTGADGIYRWLHPETNQWVDEPQQIGMPTHLSQSLAYMAAEKSPMPPTWEEYAKQV